MADFVADNNTASGDNCDDEETDLRLVCGATTWEIYKTRLSQQSPVLEREIIMHERVMRLPIDSSYSLAVDAMLRYFDHNEYLQIHSADIVLHARVFALAGRYKVAGLSAEAEVAFKREVTASKYVIDWPSMLIKLYDIPCAAASDLRLLRYWALALNLNADGLRAANVSRGAWYLTKT